VVTDGVAFLDHAGGKLCVSVDVLPDHKERRRDLEIGQDLEHPFGVRIHGAIVEGKVCAHRLFFSTRFVQVLQ
jgi:hypothetical protein